MTLSLPEEIYRKIKRRTDVKWSEVARRAIVQRLETMEGPVGYHTSTAELRKKIANAGVRLDKISIDKAAAHYKRMRELERKRISTTRAS